VSGTVRPLVRALADVLDLGAEAGVAVGLLAASAVGVAGGARTDGPPARRAQAAGDARLRPRALRPRPVRSSPAARRAGGG
jgi:hypothetical protein